MPALVLEGGTFRPIFSCGIMDALNDYNIEFPYVIGVSAGITDGVSYVSKQRGRNYDMFMKYRNDPRYFGVRNIPFDRSIFGVHFIFEYMPNELFPFDWDTYYNSGVEVKAAVTDAVTAEVEYLDGMELEPTCTILKATTAQPIVFPPVFFKGKQYFDGGIVDSIPAKKAYEDGHHKQLIILTQPEGYVKTLEPAVIADAFLIRRQYPAISEALKNRHNVYNEQIEYVKKLEESKEALVLRPTEEYQVRSLESDLEKLDRLYRYGYDLAVSRMDEIKKLFV